MSTTQKWILIELFCLFLLSITFIYSFVRKIKNDTSEMGSEIPDLDLRENNCLV